MALLAHPLVGQRELATNCRALLVAEAGHRGAANERPVVLRRRRRGLKTDARAARVDGAASRFAAGRRSHPHHLGSGRVERARGAVRPGACRRGRRARRPFVGRPPFWQASTSRRGGGATRPRRSPAGRRRSSSATTPSRVLRAGTDAAGASPSSAVPASTASGLRRTAGTGASRRSVPSPATGAAAATSGSPRWPAAARGEDARGARTTPRGRRARYFGLGDHREVAGAPPAAVSGAGWASLHPLVFARGRADSVAAGSSTGWPRRSSRSPGRAGTGSGWARGKVEVLLGGGLSGPATRG